MRMLAVSCGLLLAACGSSSDAGLFGSTQSGTGGGAAVGGSAAGSSGNGGLASGGSGNNGTGGTTASGGSGATGGEGTSGEPGTGGEVNTGGGAGMGGDGTGGNPAAGAVSCGGINNCKRPSNFCCVFLSGTAVPTPTCQANAAPCFPGTVVLCDGPEDCINGTVCCGQLVNSPQFGQAYNDIQCKPAHECEYSKDRRVICGDSTCPGGLKCRPSNLLPDINLCSPKSN